MKKKQFKICIAENKVSIIAIVVSLIYSIIWSYIGAFIMIEAGLGNGKIVIFDLANLLMPVLCVIFGMGMLLFIVVINIVSSHENKKIKK